MKIHKTVALKSTKMSCSKKSSGKEAKGEAKELSFELTAPLPTRNAKNQLVFQDEPEFRLVECLGVPGLKVVG